MKFDCYIHVAGDPSTEEDDGVPGIYWAVMEAHAPIDIGNLKPEEAHAIAEAALDEFHGKNGIEVLDDFVITAFLENGTVVSELDDVPPAFPVVVANYMSSLSKKDLPKAVRKALPK